MMAQGRAAVVIQHGHYKIYINDTSFLSQVMRDAGLAPQTRMNDTEKIIDTALQIQKAISEHYGTNFSTLAQAMKFCRKALPTPLRRKVEEVNKAASLLRHNALQVA